MNKDTKLVIEVRTDEAGNVLHTGEWIFSRKYREGDTFIDDYKEYVVLKSDATFGKHGAALLENVVRLVRDTRDDSAVQRE